MDQKEIRKLIKFQNKMSFTYSMCYYFSNFRNAGPPASESYRGYPGYPPQQGPRPPFVQQQQPPQSPAASSTPPHSQPPIMPPASSVVPPVTASTSPQAISAAPVPNSGSNPPPSPAQSGIPPVSVPTNYPGSAGAPPGSNQPDFYNRPDQVSFRICKIIHGLFLNLKFK
jgi:hypothetical protein